MLMKRLVDLHTHTKYSQDSKNEPEDSCKRAIELGLKGVAFTDHSNMLWADRKDQAEDIFACYDEVVKLRDKYPALEILTGVELGEGIRNDGEVKRLMSGREYDVVICSVHHTLFGPNKIPYSEIDFSVCTDEFLLDYMLDYLDEVKQTVEKIDGDVIAHLTCPLRYIEGKYHRIVDESKLYDSVKEILALIIKNDKALEINTSGLGSYYGKFLPGEWVVQLYYDLGGRKVTLGSDAHVAKNVGNCFDQAIEMLKRIGFDRVYYYKRRQPMSIEI